jgi:hypothetical protein
MANCLIWGTPAQEMPRLGLYRHFKSPRTDGEYKITGTVEARVEELSPKEKKRVTSWIVSQHRAGIPAPVIESYNIDEILSRPLMPFSERVDRTILFFGDRTSVGGTLAIDNVDSVARERNQSYLALTECADVGEAQLLLKMMTDMHLLRVTQETLFSLAPQGWTKYEDLQKKAVNSAQAFVAMWFNPATEEPYQNGLYKAIYDSGYDPRRVDQQHHHLNKVDDEIIAEIRRSRFRVADFTCEPGKVRGGVYFEAGFARGLNIPIIWTCRDTSMGDLHFDTRQYPHIVWKDSTDLYKRLKDRIGALIGDGPKQRA